MTTITARQRLLDAAVEAFAEKGAFGPDVAEHVQAYAPFVDAGFDEVYVANMGPHYADLIAAYGSDVLPQLRGSR